MGLSNGTLDNKFEGNMQIGRSFVKPVFGTGL
jgi:hypothetical protein